MKFLRQPRIPNQDFDDNEVTTSIKGYWKNDDEFSFNDIMLMEEMRGY